MGWRGTLKSIAAAQRRASRAQVAHARQSQRAATRARADLLRQHQAMQVAHERTRAQYDFQMYENYLELIVSLHKDAWSPWNWQLVANGPAPPRLAPREHLAHQHLQAYQPSLVDRATGHDRVNRGLLEQA